MEEKKYKINGVLSSPYELIMLARDYDRDYDTSHYYETKVAEEILKKCGYQIIRISN
jgi:hypothetical protein